MIELLPSPGSDVVALRAGGTLTERDIERAWASMDAALDESGEIGLYIEVVDLKGASLRAIVADVTTGLQNLGKLKHFRRIALVTDTEWLQTVAKVEDWLLPGIDLRAFTTAEDGAAIAWLTAHTEPLT